MIEYKIDVLQALKDKGYTTYKLRKDKLLSESTINRLRKKENVVDISSLDKICKMLKCQPGSILRYIPDVEEE